MPNECGQKAGLVVRSSSEIGAIGVLQANRTPPPNNRTPRVTGINRATGRGKGNCQTGTRTVNELSGLSWGLEAYR